MMSNGLMQILFIMVAFVGIAVPFVAISAIKQSRKQAKEYDRKLQLLANEVNQLRSSLVDPVNRLFEVEQRNRRFNERLEQLELREKSNRQYDQAVKLVHKGSSIEDIMSICGLNRGEAELIKVMNDLQAKQEAESQVM